MSIAFSYTDAEQKISEVDVNRNVRHAIASRQFSMQQLSELMGKPGTFIKNNLAGKRISLPLLYALSVHLKQNLFEPFLTILPEPLRATQRETALQEEIASLQKQLAEMTKERDIYKEVALRK